MSAKITKGGKDYPLGVLPQNVINDVTELKNKIKVVEGTTSNAINTNVFVPFPSGFTAQNSIIVGYTVHFATVGWYSNHVSLTTMSDDTNGVRVSVSESALCGQPFKVVLMKIS